MGQGWKIGGWDRRKARCAAALILLAAGCALFLLGNVLCGSISISPREIAGLFTGKGMEEASRRIVMDIRLPRALAAFWLGGALALSGYLLQTFFHNPIAGPFVLGISSGSKLAVALVTVLLWEGSVRMSSAALITASFLGALLSMGFVLLMSGRAHTMSLLVVCGVMIGYICSAITDFIVAFAEDAEIVNLHNWSKGSFSGMSWEHVAVMAAVLSLTVAAVFALSKPIGAYRLGEAYAQSLGVNVRLIRILLILLSSLLSACVVAYAGPVSFVGIAVPHLVKSLLGTSSPIWMVPACFLGGSMSCLACDLLARTLFAPTELSISTVTAVFGAPVVLWVMVGRKRAKEGSP